MELTAPIAAAEEMTLDQYQAEQKRKAAERKEKQLKQQACSASCRSDHSNGTAMDGKFKTVCEGLFNG